MKTIAFEFLAARSLDIMRSNASILLIVILILGGGGGYYLGLNRAGLSLSDSGGAEDFKVKYENLQEKLQNFSDHDLADYLRLKDQQQNYQKADELLGKMMQLLLIDIVVKLSKSDLDKISQMAKSQGADVVRGQDGIPDGADEKLRKKSAGGSDVGGVPDWKQIEHQISDVKSNYDIERLQKSMAVDNLFPILKSKLSLDDRAASLLEGTFVGKIVLDDTSKKPLEVRLKLEGSQESDPDKKKYEIEVLDYNKMSKEGKPSRSSSAGNGVWKFSLVSGSYQGFIIEISQDYYAHVYYVPQLDQLIGNYYKKIELDRYEKVGSMDLGSR